MPRTFGVIVAAGRGTRFGGSLPKQYLPLGSGSVLRHSVVALAGHTRITGVVVVIRDEDRARCEAALAGVDVLALVAGGAERQDSVRAGLQALSAYRPDRVLVHDGARPFPGASLIDRVVDALDGSDAVLPALALRDTIKRVHDGTVVGTADREELWRAQTPQGFEYARILAAHEARAGEALTDDCAVAEAAGMTVHVVQGSEDNIKVTTPGDLEAAERLLRAELGDIRIGQGFDVHAFGPGDHVWLCGVAVPHEGGLVGHSDADVGLHALTDALLGAIGAGDIGQHFPPSDPQWRGAPSDRFLAHAASLIRSRGGVIASCDVTVVCERPKVGPHRPAMIARVAGILGIAPDRVSVKATTTEELGFTGRREGIAAQAIATVRLPG